MLAQLFCSFFACACGREEKKNNETVSIQHADELPWVCFIIAPARHGPAHAATYIRRSFFNYENKENQKKRLGTAR